MFIFCSLGSLLLFQNESDLLLHDTYVYLHDTFTIKSYFSVIQTWSYHQRYRLHNLETSLMYSLNVLTTSEKMKYCIHGGTTIVLVQNKVCSFSWRCVIQCNSWFIFGIATRLLIVIIINVLRILLLGTILGTICIFSI